jgi:D-3-phosphoglycerate dehydrogenase / 2-oxoglutarate reductase
MSDTTIDSLVLDLLEWIGPHPRPYGEVLDAWRTSCPRLPIWEEANARRFVIRHFEPETGQTVSVSEEGRQYLQSHARALLAAGGSA